MNQNWSGGALDMGSQGHSILVGSREKGRKYGSGPLQMCQSVLPCHANYQGELGAGQLLKWMDTIACLAAERHAGTACVTASMDDIRFEETVRVGQVINIKARVNRAFNTSMEVGIYVMVQEVLSGVMKRVCAAFSTFVVKPRGTQKVTLKPVDVHGSVEEMLEHSLASERRRLRLYNEEAFKNLMMDYYNLQDKGLWNRKAIVPLISTELTRVESIELVLPPHANHHGNTFGGQIMAWMENVATLAASRLCSQFPSLRAVDMFQFRGPSSVGDRLVFKAMVNNAFQTSVEVGVRVEAYNCEKWSEGTPRHINSAFMIYYIPVESERQTFPDVTFTTHDGERRFLGAVVRKRIRMARKHILYSRDEGSISVPWGRNNQVYLGYNNVAALLVLAGKQGWEANNITDKVEVYVHEEADLLCLRVDMEVRTSAFNAFSLLNDLRLRPCWDKHYLSCEEVEKGDEEETVYHVKCGTIHGGKHRDFVFLLSKRQPCKDGDPYVIALRSVTVATVPPDENCIRSEAKCAGFLIHEISYPTCKVSYYNQVTSGVLPYVEGNLAGWSKSMEETAMSCISFLEQDLLTTMF
ncbi:acetyl-coenzyme A thioesterase [Myxocyprinus asiaticus]|uniref:acetyl-coenzyme A thioesterase n=1 Tax=Myxocyprinus asiaticus TaxID=70543 RepID=UPI0022212F70|nr:acetyl-coenzyme A thioesterase [Myxocyprinus asiaticus]